MKVWRLGSCENFVSKCFPLEFCRNVWREKTRIPGLSYGVCLHDPTFSHFGTVPACARQTDKQTDGHTSDTTTALYSASKSAFVKACNKPLTFKALKVIENSAVRLITYIFVSLL